MLSRNHPDRIPIAFDDPGPFHSLVIPAQAGIYTVLPRESCHRSG